MNEWELEEIKKRAAELESENFTYGKIHDLGEETHTVCLDAQRLVGEVRRYQSFASENVELRERVGELEQALLRIKQFRWPMWEAKIADTALSSSAPKLENQEEEA